ncbi:Retrovirus-related Pol polyprotein from transposon TNT 1-94 [Zea mays]|uniref:Retrovirus-related Pol polyprotein from transposon TNT 1-94 n=1 Tax=Zea mays TaxID=4577 RepID=A0A1D6LC15_MAIZE|nr:Retrovirus-related Pol polyprotein from transposon TNT 1-94 [Zea mays]
MGGVELLQRGRPGGPRHGQPPRCRLLRSSRDELRRGGAAGVLGGAPGERRRQPPGRGRPVPGVPAGRGPRHGRRPLRAGQGAVPRRPLPGGRHPGAVAVLDGHAQERQHRPVPAMAHLPERQPRAPPRRSPLPLRRLPRVLLPRERGARGAAHHLLRRLQQPAGAGDPAAAAAPRVGRVRLPDGQGTGVGRRPQGVGPRRRRHVPGALLLPGPRHAAGQEAVDVARRRHGDIRQRQGRGGGVDAQWLRHPCAGQVYQVTATGQQQLLVDRHFNVTVRYAE